MKYMNIRRQEKNDCSGIAHVVTLTWNEAYKDIVSRDFLDNLYVTEHDRADEAYKKTQCFAADKIAEKLLDLLM